MGLGVGQRQYTLPEQGMNLRSLSAKRVQRIIWQRHHPNYNSELAKLKSSIDKTQQRLFSLNKTSYKLKRRISQSKRPKLYLIASLANVSRCKEAADREMDARIMARTEFAGKISEWDSLSLLDEQISQARYQRQR